MVPKGLPMPREHRSSVQLTAGLRNIPQSQTCVTFVKSSSVTACETVPCSNATFDMHLGHFNIENIGHVSPEGGWKKNLSVLFSSGGGGGRLPNFYFSSKGKGREREDKTKRRFTEITECT